MLRINPNSEVVNGSYRGHPLEPLVCVGRVWSGRSKRSCSARLSMDIPAEYHSTVTFASSINKSYL